MAEHGAAIAQAEVGIAMAIGIGERRPLAAATNSGNGVPQSSIQCMGTPCSQWRAERAVNSRERGFAKANRSCSRSIIVRMADRGTPAIAGAVIISPKIGGPDARPS